MSLPKNRQTIYIVNRLTNNESYESTAVAACRSPEYADALAGRYSQEMKDSRIFVFEFEVQAVTYYDE